MRRWTRPASVMERLRGVRGAAHPMQGHLSQERRYASPSFRGHQGPDRRRQIAHRGIQANAPGRIALRTRFSAIRPVSSIYERRREWDIEPSFRDSKDLRFGLGMSALRIEDPQRRDRLLLLNAFAILLLTILGAAGEASAWIVNCEPAPPSAASIPCSGKAACSTISSPTCPRNGCGRSSSDTKNSCAKTDPSPMRSASRENEGIHEDLAASDVDMQL